MFEGFEEFDIRVSDTTIHGRVGGAGPPVLLLHGIPETHLMWHRIAPRLAQDHTVVATDLRGHGDSGKPRGDDKHRPYAMREIARDQVEVMQQLGHTTFAVVGHDRGARCAYRLALDHPESCTRVSVLDIIPTGDAFRLADHEFSIGYWVWSFLGAEAPVPERLIEKAPDVLVNYMLDSWSVVPDAFPPAVRREYIEKFSDAETVHAICEQYRAAATVDVHLDESDRGRRKITCPLQVLWSKGGPVDRWYEPLGVWSDWATDVQGGPIDAGHFLPEEAPHIVAEKLGKFLTPQLRGRRHRHADPLRASG